MGKKSVPATLLFCCRRLHSGDRAQDIFAAPRWVRIEPCILVVARQQLLARIVVPQYPTGSPCDKHGRFCHVAVTHGTALLLKDGDAR